jgi:hypothetical protein
LKKKKTIVVATFFNGFAARKWRPPPFFCGFRWVFFKRVGIALRLVFSFKLVILELIFTSTNWNVGVSLQYYIYTYLYQLEFWGTIAILALVLTFTN